MFIQETGGGLTPLNPMEKCSARRCKTGKFVARTCEFWGAWRVKVLGYVMCGKFGARLPRSRTHLHVVHHKHAAVVRVLLLKTCVSVWMQGVVLEMQQ